MKFTSNQVIAMVVGGVVLLGAGYWAGTANAHGAGGATQFGAAGQGAPGAGRGQFGGGRGGAGGMAATGTILSQDSSTLTIATQGGGSRIVLISASTTVMTEATSSLGSLKQGETVTVLGPVNSDGSVSARSIQARP